MRGIISIFKSSMKSRKISHIALGILGAIILNGNGGAVEKDGGFVMYPGRVGSAAPVIFSHQSHGIRGAGFECNKCHAGGSPKTMMVTMDGIRQGQGCGSCHDGKTKGPRGLLAAASIQDCSLCHMPAANIVITLNRMDPVAFSHIRHLAADVGKKISKPAGFSCGNCHPTPFERVAKGPVGMQVPHETGGCAYCHNGQKRGDGNPPAFAATARCLTCHKPL
jgi:c(7)-type cytochrome triheme protein